MAGNMKLDPDFAAYMATLPAVSPPASNDDKPPESKAEASRQRLEFAVSGYLARLSPISGLLQETKHIFTSHDGVEIAIYEFSHKDLSQLASPSPAFLYFHGGGNISCPIDPICRPSIAQFALDFSVRTFGVEFRLAPEHPYPTPVEDCYAGLKWVTENAQRLNIDPRRIGLFGESGGGGLVAGVSLLARDRQLSPPIAKQMMAYPMLDDRSSKRHFIKDSPRDESLRWFIDLIDECWSEYLGASGMAEVSEYAAPARATDLRGLPPTYIDVGGLDWFRDETLEFATRLAKADVDVEVHLYRGVPHCFDLIAPDIPLVKNAKANRMRAVQGV